MKAEDIENIRRAAKKLLDSVDFDNNGIIVGQVRTGGNGGLISLDTVRAADNLRIVLDSTAPTA
jgi:hypothetical protein